MLSVRLAVPSVTIAETQRPLLISWLRSLVCKSNSARLTWETPGHMTLTHRDYETVSATIQVPVAVESPPPEIAFDPKHMAKAFEIGPILRLVNKQPFGALESQGSCLNQPMAVLS